MPVPGVRRLVGPWVLQVLQALEVALQEPRELPSLALRWRSP